MFLRLIALALIFSSLLFTGYTLANQAEKLGKEQQHAQVSMDIFKQNVRE